MKRILNHCCIKTYTTFSFIVSGVIAIFHYFFRKIDPRIRGVIASSVGVCFIFHNTENSLTTNIGLGLKIAGTIDFINSIRGGMISENKHSKHVWVLMEDGRTLRKLRPYQTIGILRKINGIATSFNPGHVYKVPTGCMAKILPNGDIQLSSAISRFINNRLDEKAGWKDYSFVEENPDWSELYKKTCEHIL